LAYDEASVEYIFIVSKLYDMEHDISTSVLRLFRSSPAMHNWRDAQNKKLFYRRQSFAEF
jgi:hypothetical protein